MPELAVSELAVLELKAVSKRYRSIPAVENVSFTLQPGEVLGYLGPNGSGKSTTVKMMTGLLQPTSGDATINGLSITRQPLEAKRIIGVLPEGNALFHSLSIWEHLLLCG